MTDSKITFKQYIQDARDQLEAAMGQVPTQVTEYDVKTYCRLMVGESMDDKLSINLKPGHTIAVLWEYAKKNDPTPLNIRFSNVEELDSDAEFDLYWSKSQLTKWLCKNTKR